MLEVLDENKRGMTQMTVKSYAHQLIKAVAWEGSKIKDKMKN